MHTPNQPYDPMIPYEARDWTAEDILLVAQFVLLESFPNWREDDGSIHEFLDEVERLSEKLPLGDIRGYIFSEESVAILGIFVHTSSVPDEGLHRLLF